MKKKISILLFMILTIALVASFTACGDELETSVYDIIEINYLPDHKDSEPWKYIESHEQYGINRANEVKLAFEVKIKDSAGQEHTDTFWIYAISGKNDIAYFSIGAESAKISYSVADIPDTEAARNVPVVVTFSQYSEENEKIAVKFSESKNVTVNIDIVKAIRDYDLSLTENFKSSYNVGEELDLTGANLDLTYRDDTVESISVSDILKMPHFKGTNVSGFNSEILGLRKSLIFNIKYNGGSSGKSVNYKVLPNEDWSVKSVSNIDYYLRQDMTASTVDFHHLDFEQVALLNSNVVIKMAYDKNYIYTAINPSVSTYQKIINAKLTVQNYLYSAFNALIPEGQTATVSSADTTRGATAVEYTLTNGTKNTMYVIMTSFTGNLNKQNVITITIEKSNLMTDTEKAAVLDFVSLVKIK